MKPVAKESIRRIWIRGTNWVGDAILSIPAMKELRRVLPSAHIALMVRPWVRDVYSAADFIDELIEYDRQDMHKGWHGLHKASLRIRDGEFDLAILMQNAFEAALLAWLARVPRRAGYSLDGRGLLLTHGYPVSPAVRKVHQAYYYLEILGSMGLLPRRLWDDPDFEPSIRISVHSEDRASAREILREGGIDEDGCLIGLNPGAYYGWAKRWLTDRYAAVADILADRHGARILIFGSGGEQKIALEVASRMRHRPTILTGRTTLGQLMALLEKCRLLITNDSGPMHLAAALDVPQVAIFGSTSVEATGPISSRARIVQHPVSCNPCFLRECPIDFRCMKKIAIEDVVSAAEACGIWQ